MTVVLGQTPTLDARSSSLIKYADMRSDSDRPRTNSVTEAKRARCTAACPAEFAPPTTKAGWPSSAVASVTAASDNPVVGRKPAGEVPLQGGDDVRVIVDRQQHRLRHAGYSDPGDCAVSFGPGAGISVSSV
jgi:hypothetical protein